MMHVASLAMYDRPEVHSANDALWEAVRSRLAAAGLSQLPVELDRGRSLGHIWSSPDLILAQCCGYPLLNGYRDRLQVIAVPRYRIGGRDTAVHHSLIVVRREEAGRSVADFRFRRAAVNSTSSNTGYNLFRAAVAPLAGGEAFFSEVLVTGSHDMTARYIAADQADIGAIDVMSFAHLQRFDPATAARLRAVGITAAVPNLPFVTSQTIGADTLSLIRRALDDAAADPALKPAMDALSLSGFETGSLSDYQPISDLETEASRLGYPTLH